MPRREDPDESSTWSDGNEPSTARPLPPPESGYEPRGLLGKGAMGEVHLAYDRALRREVALKRMDPGRTSAQLLARFRSEVQITAQLEHPGIVPVHSLHDNEAGQPEYAMKVVRGETLEEWLDEVRQACKLGKPEPEGRDLRSRLEVFLDVCDAMAYAHSRDVVHRDLKPENIMIGPYRQVYVMDWGLAKVVRSGDANTTWGPELMETELFDESSDGGVTTASDSSTKTRYGATLGTPAYMAPEQAQNSALVTAAADQYALGLVLQELVTLGRARPHVHGKEVLAYALLGGREPWVPAYPGLTLPEDLRAIVERATQKLASHRYPGVEELSADLRRYLRGEEVSVYPDNVQRRLVRGIAQHGQQVLLGLMGFGLLAAGGVAAVLVHSADVQALTDKLVVANQQAHRIDTALRGYESLISGLVYAAEHALQNPAPERSIVPQEDWQDEATRPSHARPANFYNTLSSVRDVDFGFAPGVRAEDHPSQMLQLASLYPALRDVLLDSKAFNTRELDSETQTRLVLDEGVPIVWSYVASEQGLIVGYPGTIDTYDEGYDPRTRPWYQLAASTPGPRWSALDADESNMGLLLTCSMAVREGGALLGVAGIDLTFGHVIDDLLVEPVSGAEAFLVDERGAVIVRSSQREAARTVTQYAPAPFPFASAVADITDADRPAGHVEHDGRLFVWASLDAVPWRYVLADTLSRPPEALGERP